MTTLVPDAQTSASYVGLDIGGTKVRALVADADGHVLRAATERTAADVLAQVERLVGAFGGGTARAVGIGVPGAVHPVTGVVSKVPNVAALDGVPLARTLHERLGLPVAVENDLIAAALAEHSVGSHGGEILAVVAAGTGIGLGLVHGGNLVRGDTGAAGEIADLPLGDGRILEDAVSIAGLLGGYRARGGDDAHGVPEVLVRAAASEPAAAGALDEYAAYLAHAVRIIAAVLDPGRIVLTGGIGSHATVVAALDGHLDDALRRRVAPSTLGSDSPAHGAVLLAHAAAAAHTRTAAH